jgi:fatty-acyl-CoA synthase
VSPARLVRLRQAITAAALACAVAAPLLIGLGAVGARQGWFDIHIGFDWLAVRIAPALAIIGAALGLLALLAALSPPRGRVWPALLAVALGAAVGGACGWWRAGAVRALPVHDTATEWADPILFSPTLMLARGPHTNPVESAPAVPYSRFSIALAGQPVAVVNARTCPAATPITVTAPPADAYGRLRGTVRRAGLTLVTDDPRPDDRGRRHLEATATGRWFGFKDDLAARLQPAGAGTRIDLRVTSRLGLTDFGRGCRLIGRLRRRIGD